ncbi:MAG: hypothetical protein LBG70_00245, partial [Bifidobacteriaceae bacterium]|nr:hypothetical protein [Bifidobacteriaceae bacterium]
MSNHPPRQYHRGHWRQRLLGGGLAVALVVGLSTVTVGTVASADPLDADPVAQTYYDILLRHTKWAEQGVDNDGRPVWRQDLGRYTDKDRLGQTLVLGNAVLLTRGTYDPAKAGVDYATLKAHTVDSIQYYAAADRFAGGSLWGGSHFWDSTYESYFTLAAHLLWSDLDQTTRDNVDKINAGIADYTTSMLVNYNALTDQERFLLDRYGEVDNNSYVPTALQADLAAAKSKANAGHITDQLYAKGGLAGQYQGDTVMEEIGVFAQSLGPALAWLPNNANANDWQRDFAFWSAARMGMRTADAANPATIDGVPVSDNPAQTIYDTFAVENHESVSGHYMEEAWRTPARSLAHFIAAGIPASQWPESLTVAPNSQELWQTDLSLMSSSGVPFQPANEERTYLYGRDIMARAYLSQIIGDRYAARVEANLADELGPYLDLQPGPALTKFNGESKYEGEARAELGIAYMLHEWRANSGQGLVTPVSDEQLFAKAAGVTDYGAKLSKTFNFNAQEVDLIGPGLLTHQTADGWAGVVTRNRTDPDWWRMPMIRFAWGPQHDNWLIYAAGDRPGFIPFSAIGITGRQSAVYHQQTDGYDASASVVEIIRSGDAKYAAQNHGLGYDDILPNLGVRDLSGHPTYAGFVTLPTGTVIYATSGGLGDKEGVLKVMNAQINGIAGMDGQRTYTTGAGQDVIGTSMTVAGRGLGFIPHAVGRFGDGNNCYPDGFPQLASSGCNDHKRDSNWLTIDGRVSLIKRNSINPINIVSGSQEGLDTVIMSDGPEANHRGLLVEGYPVADAATAARLAARPAVTTDSPALVATDADGYVALFNLASADLTDVSVYLTQSGSSRTVFDGSQRFTSAGSVLAASLAGGHAEVRAPRFTV